MQIVDWVLRGYHLDILSFPIKRLTLNQNAYRSESVTKFPRKFRGANRSCTAPAVGSS